MERLSQDEKRLLSVSGGNSAEPSQQQELLKQSKVLSLASEIALLNENLQLQNAQVPRGANLKVPGKDSPLVVPENTTLGEIARQTLGSADKAGILQDTNPNVIRPATSFPANAAIRVPQHNWPALAAFGALSLLLAIVGMGWLMQPSVTPPNIRTGKPNS